MRFDPGGIPGNLPKMEGVKGRCEGGSQSRGVSVKWVIHTTVWAIHTDRAGVAEVKRGQGEIWTGGRGAGKFGVGAEKAGIRTEIADLSEVTGGHLRDDTVK